MAFLPHGFVPDASFTPLFRLLDDFDNYRSETGHQDTSSRQRRIATRAFSPKFDVRETENSYELHGELPGIERNNVHIEFTDPQTMVIRGRIERTYTAGTHPASIDNGAEQAGSITEKGEERVSHKATVEDEPAGEAKEGQVAKRPETKASTEKPKAPAEKYWVSERSIGEFSRTFNFPSRVDQNSVGASLDNGILNVTVPKAKKHESRRIAVN